MAKKVLKFTALGDDGSTGLLGEGRYQKSDIRFEVLGSLDECSAILGLAKSIIDDARIKDLITLLQRDLYQIMGELSATSENRKQFSKISDEAVNRLEQVIGELNAEADNPSGFIIPGDSIESAVMDVARTSVRRAERRISQFFDQEIDHNPIIRKYVNRLSTLLYSLELVIVTRKKSSPPTMAKPK